MPKLRFLLVLFFSLILSTATLVRAAEYSVKKELAVEFSNEEIPIDVAVSADRAHVAVEFRNGGKRYIQDDRGYKSESFDFLVGMNFSPNGLLLAYMYSKKNRYHVNVDGKKYGKYFWLNPDSVTFSDDSKHFFFVATHKKRADADEDYFVVHDGSKGKSYSSQVGPLPVFSPGKQTLSYFARKKRDYYFVQGEQQGPKFEQTADGPHFSDDGEVFAYIGVENDLAYVVVNDTSYGPYYDCGDIDLSPDGSKVAYYAMPNKGDRRQVYINGVLVEGYYASQLPSFSPDGSIFAMWASDGEEQFALINSKQDSAFGFVSDVRFSPNGSISYYRVLVNKEDSTRRFVFNGVLQKEMFGELKSTPVFFSPDESRIAYVWDVDSTEDRVVIDGEEFGPYTMVGEVVFSEDSKRVGYLASLTEERGDLFVVLDGIVQESLHEGFVGPNISFSPLNNDITYYLNSRENKNRALVINDRLFEWHNNTFPMDVKFNSEGVIVYYAFGEDGLYRVTVTPN